MLTELIDVKSRQTLSGYPTLKALYDRYLNSENYCLTTSSKFDYLTVNEFAGLIGDYWVDIVEQVMPATTIWGRVLGFIQIQFLTNKSLSIELIHQFLR
jgi:hypothetical protein